MLHLKSLAAGILACAALSQASAATFVGDRSDFRDETIYFAMTTRFYDGDHSNNTYCWDGVNNVNDPEWRGDFKGLIQKLDYIKALGFTAIWITPVVENASGLDYHGYHAINFQKVDPRYESEDCKFQDLIDAAHARGMKVVLDVVLQHTGNFGEEYLCPMFEKDYTQPLSNINKSMKLHPDSKLPSNYFQMQAKDQYGSRLNLMKNIQNNGGDPDNYWHHIGQAWDWDDYSRVWGQIAGDCVDLNTENPHVYNYITDCYSKFIDMGVDGFRVDTSGHIARVTFNKVFVPKLMAAAEKAKAKRGGTPFFMYGEVCARAEEVIYRNQNYNCSPCFYTWAETKEYAWDDSEQSWKGLKYSEAAPGDYANHPNTAAVLSQAKDYQGHADAILQKSTNAWLNGNDYHKPDYSKSSNFNVIDFPMHWRFHRAENAFGVNSEDNLYNDATWNVVYVDGHDYGPNGWDTKSFGGSLQEWAENYSLMFTFRGIPCIFQGSECYFKKGGLIDKGAIEPLKNTSRAYFGGYLEGDVNVSDFAAYSGATGNMAATLSHPLALHLQRLNKIRAAVPALRKGQYSTAGCQGKMAFKRRYTDANTDSYVLVTVSGDAAFSNILNGTYTDVITGDKQVVTNGKLSVSCSGKGNLRAYVLDTDKTKAPGKIGNDQQFLYTSAAKPVAQLEYTSEKEPLDTETVRDNENVPGGGGGGEVVEPDVPVTPSMNQGEQAVFFENTNGWNGFINCYMWNGATQFSGSWPGSRCTYLGNNIWKFTYTGNAVIPQTAGVIFNNGGEQTEDFKFVNGGYYNNNGYVKTIEGAGEIVGPPVIPDDPKSWQVWFQDADKNWDKVYCYVWDDNQNEAMGKWPGKEMSATTLNGAAAWTITYDGVLTNPMIIFHNNQGTQTANLVMENNAIYNFNGIFVSGIESVTVPEIKVRAVGGALEIFSPAETVVTIYRIDGTAIMTRLIPGVNRIDNLAKGLYIVAGKKVML